MTIVVNYVVVIQEILNVNLFIGQQNILAQIFITS